MDGLEFFDNCLCRFHGFKQLTRGLEHGFAEAFQGQELPGIYFSVELLHLGENVVQLCDFLRARQAVRGRNLRLGIDQVPAQLAPAFHQESRLLFRQGWRILWRKRQHIIKPAVLLTSRHDHFCQLLRAHHTAVDFDL